MEGGAMNPEESQVKIDYADPFCVEMENMT